MKMPDMEAGWFQNWNCPQKFKLSPDNSPTLPRIDNDKRLRFCDNPPIVSFQHRFVIETTQNKPILMILERI